MFFFLAAKNLNELKQELELDVHRVELQELCKRFNTNIDTGLTPEAVQEGHKLYGNYLIIGLRSDRDMMSPHHGSHIHIEVEVSSLYLYLAVVVFMFTFT